LAKLKSRLIKRTSISLILKRLAWPLLENINIKVTMPYAAGARRLQNPLLDGNGSLQKKSGIDGMIISGTTGESQRKASLMSGGHGIKASGIIMAMSIDSIMDTGTGSRARDGLYMLRNSLLLQVFQEVQKYADLSIFRKNSDSHPHSLRKNYQDVKLDKARRLLFSCGPLMPNADSSEEDSSITRSKSVSLESLTLGKES